MQDDEEYLISYVNLKNNLIKYQKNFSDPETLKSFYKNEFYGFPQCLPINIKYFNYSKSQVFKIDRKKFSKKIFNTNNINYIGNKKFFRYGEYFAFNVTLKEKYLKTFKKYSAQIKSLKKKILITKKKYKNVCSMQIRNAPHYGHEAVFKFLIKKFDFVILNPIFGIKRKNDFSNKYISQALKFIEKI